MIKPNCGRTTYATTHEVSRFVIAQTRLRNRAFSPIHSLCLNVSISQEGNYSELCMYITLTYDSVYAPILCY